MSSWAGFGPRAVVWRPLFYSMKNIIIVWLIFGSKVLSSFYLLFKAPIF